MLELTINNEVGEMEALAPFVEEMGNEFALDMAFILEVQLVLDEAVSNVINYAYSDCTGKPICLQADMVEATNGHRQLVIRMIDQGVAFDPITNAPVVDGTQTIEERPVGGLGIFLIQQIMDEVRYSRVDNQNILTMIKNI